MQTFKTVFNKALTFKMCVYLKHLQLRVKFPLSKALVNGETTVKWYVKDQHGAQLDDSAAANSTDYKVVVTVTGATYATFSGHFRWNNCMVILQHLNSTEINWLTSTNFIQRTLTFVAVAAGNAKVTAELFKSYIFFEEIRKRA